MNEKNTSFHTICRLLLKELRVERGITQAHVSQLLGMASTSSWSKVESGEATLTLEHILTACSACQVWPAEFFATAQNYMALFSQNGWYVAFHGSPLSKEDDQLSTSANEYYAAVAATNAQVPNVGMYPILRTPWPFQGVYAPLSVFLWALDFQWQKSQKQYFQSLPKNKGKS